MREKTLVPGPGNVNRIGGYWNLSSFHRNRVVWGCVKRRLGPVTLELHTLTNKTGIILVM